MANGREQQIASIAAIPADDGLLACPDCDLLQRIPVLEPGAAARCPRCGHVVASSKPDSLDRTLALALAAAVVLVIANISPLMELSVSGRQASTTIIGGAGEMWIRGQRLTALLVVFCTVFAPAFHIAITATVTLFARRSAVPHWLGILLRWSEWHRSWAMVEVMMLGILVALIKMAELATIIPGLGLFAAGFLVLLITAMTVNFDPQEIWNKVSWAGPAIPPAVRLSAAVKGSGGFLTGGRLGIIRCESCGLLSRPAYRDEPGDCPRCGAALKMRRPNSIERTWALLIAALICYVPANFLPVMITQTLRYKEGDTIMSGVVILFKTGSWHLALIVLIASIMIPLAKIAALAFLLITIQRRSARDRHERLRLYRLVEFVGRWSMLDVFVVTFSVALIQMQPFMSIKPGAGVVFFAAVVVLTMIAAEMFEPRLIWDSETDSQGDKDD